MDGVLFRMDDPLPFASETILRLKNRGDAVWYLTNNSSKSRADYVEKLSRFDIEAEESCVMTSAYATSLWFRENDQVGATVFVVGESGLERELAAGGMKLVDAGAENCDYVVSGWDRKFSYSKMATAYRFISEGAKFIATNRDITYPDAGGKNLPGSGAIVASIAACTGVEPVTIGKPETFSLEIILRRAGFSAKQTIVVGDRLDTDIAIGNRAGATSVLVLTGISSRSEAEQAHGELKPDIIIETLNELI